MTASGLEWQDQRRDLRLRLGGQVHLDFARYDDDLTPIDDESGLRRLRLDLTARWGAWGARINRDFGGTVEGWKSVYVRYHGLAPARVTVGNQQTPFGLDESTSSNDLPFLERSLASALATGLNTGVSVATHGDSWAAAGGFFLDPLEDDPKKQSNGEGWIARGTWAPLRATDELWHLGASVELRDVDEGSEYRIRTRPESGLTDTRLVDTRSIRDVDRTVTWGVETILRRGPVLVQGELIATGLARESVDVGFQGWTLQSSWLLRGQAREYSVRRGVLGGLGPQDSWGALELSARVSHLDLEDADVTGGSETNVTFGVNWTLTENLRVVGDYVVARAEPNRDGLDEEVHVLQVRLQVAF